MSESLYAEPRELSPRAQNTLDKLGETAEDNVKQFRVSSLENIHEITIKFKHNLTNN